MRHERVRNENSCLSFHSAPVDAVVENNEDSIGLNSLRDFALIEMTAVTMTTTAMKPMATGQEVLVFS